MKLTVTGRHMELSAADRQAITRKLARLDRMLNDNAISAQCVVSEQRGLVVCELTVHARQDHMLHALARNARLVPAVGFAVDKVAQQAQRLKDRWTTRRRADVGAGRGVRRGAISRKGKGPKAAASRRVVRAR
jgi:ribosomal subunit interface protein